MVTRQVLADTETAKLAVYIVSTVGYACDATEFVGHRMKLMSNRSDKHQAMIIVVCLKHKNNHINIFLKRNQRNAKLKHEVTRNEMNTDP